MSKLFASSLLVLLALPAMSTPALAQDNAPPVHVVYRDLNLASPQGIAMLDRRLDQAADRACSALSPDTLKRRSEFAACRKAKLLEAAPQRERVLAASSSATQVASAR